MLETPFPSRKPMQNVAATPIDSGKKHKQAEIQGDLVTSYRDHASVAKNSATSSNTVTSKNSYSTTGKPNVNNRFSATRSGFMTR
ncbi:MAG: hypothetical protein ACTXOO_00155 [Sodalis sp. (in: enterobacteria)]